jgi:integrase/recombinase XerD
VNAVTLPYRPIRSRFFPENTAPGRHHQRALIDLNKAWVKWPRFWNIVSKELKRRDYSKETILVYRHALRAFSTYLRQRRRYSSRPGDVTEETVHEYVHSLSQRHCSWSWVSTNISVLRTALDKIGGLQVTSSLSTPRRRRYLPAILSRNEALRILSSAQTIRGRLLLGLMYGCGLKVSEACSLKWKNVNIEAQSLDVQYGRGTKLRVVAIPPELLPILKTGKERCGEEDFIFPGFRSGRHLSIRMAEIILRTAVKTAGIPKHVTCMTLRHSYAVHRLKAGATIREVQEAVGHENVHTTLIYKQYLLPEKAESPADALHATKNVRPIPEQRNGETLQVFDQPLTTDGIELPFGSGFSSTSADFYRLLKAHVWGRFLASRSAPTE